MDTKNAVRETAINIGLTLGIILAAAELAFGIAVYFLRRYANDFINAGEHDPGMLLPLITTWVAFLFLIQALYFTSGMLVAKRLAPLPLRSHEIAACGAVAGIVAELIRSTLAIAVNFVISYISPLAGVGSTDVLSIALANAGIRLACGLPAFVLIAALVTGISAWLFSIIFFRPESTPE